MIFKDKTAIITGGSEGIGAATARLFAEAGANLVLAARNKKNLERIADELRDKTQVVIFPMDVTDPDACADLFKKAAYEFGGVHVLVNNAGYHARGNVADVDASELVRMIDVNLRAPIMLSRIALKYLGEQNEAAIINVGSLAGRTPVPGSTTYSASKAGLRFFTLALADELRGSPIKLGLVSPGPVATGFILTDIDMPRITGFLTTITYLWPWIGRQIRPLLERKGRRFKEQYKAAQKRRESGSPDPRP